MIIIVTGSRNYKDHENIKSTLNTIHQSYGVELLFSGHCPQGADLFAEDWAKVNFIQLALFPAVWGAGLHAGFERNRIMVNVAWQMAQPKSRVRALAFAAKCVSMKCQRSDLHMSHGTADCLKRIRNIGIARKVYNDETLI